MILVQTRPTLATLKILIFLVAVALMATSCAPVPKTKFASPADTLEGMRRAIDTDSPLLFMSTLSAEALDQHGTAIRLGWNEVRERIVFLKDELAILEDATFVPSGRQNFPPDVDEAYVWPDYRVERPYRRLRLRIPFDGEVFEEDFLFVRELDDPEVNTDQSPWIQVGDQWYLRDFHPNPERYAGKEGTLEERTSWRAVYPYFPFQRGSRLVARFLASDNAAK